jgi:hypothetical protein
MIIHIWENNKNYFFPSHVQECTLFKQKLKNIYPTSNWQQDPASRLEESEALGGG